MEGKIVLITGANSGIGKSTAFALAEKKATIIMACRNEEKCREVMEEIKANTANPNVDFLKIDLASFESIRKASLIFNKKYDRLDVLINNAGGIFNPREETKNGFESSFGVNHLAPFLLTNLLLGSLKQSTSARIINTSSGLHYRGKIDFQDLQSEKKYSAIQAYANAKLATVLFTYELARKLKETNITVNCLHPGVVQTRFGRNVKMPWYLRPIALFVTNFFLSPEKGAKTSIFLASSPKIKAVTGKFFEKCEIKKSEESSYDKDLAEQLWKMSETYTGLNQYK